MTAHDENKQSDFDSETLEVMVDIPLTEGMFHESDGFFFGRKKDGTVAIVKTEQTGEQTERHPLWQHEISPDAWCSVVSSMLPEGETGDSFRFVRSLHDGTLDLAMLREDLRRGEVDAVMDMLTRALDR